VPLVQKQGLLACIGGCHPEDGEEGCVLTFRAESSQGAAVGFGNSAEDEQELTRGEHVVRRQLPFGTRLQRAQRPLGRRLLCGISVRTPAAASARDAADARGGAGRGGRGLCLLHFFCLSSVKGQQGTLLVPAADRGADFAAGLRYCGHFGGRAEAEAQTPERCQRGRVPSPLEPRHARTTAAADATAFAATAAATVAAEIAAAAAVAAACTAAIAAVAGAAEVEAKVFAQTDQLTELCLRPHQILTQRLNILTLKSNLSARNKAVVIDGFAKSRGRRAWTKGWW